MNKKQLLVTVIALAALGTLVYWGRSRIHFDFGAFVSQLTQADWKALLFATACIYAGYVFRSARWALLLRHNKRVPLFSLTGTQVMGFTAVALIGRVADPVRPYLVAKRTELPLSNQIAVYIVERLFDFGSLAVIFCSVILLAPAGQLPHAEIVRKAGYGGLAITIAAAVFLFAVRLWGSTVASLLERSLGAVSRNLGQAVGNKVRAFHTGLDTIRSFSEFAGTAAISLTMWALIALAYLETARAFTASPALAEFSLPKCILLLAISGSASALQLPVIGWFSQIAFVAAALSGIFGATPEAATACAASLLLVTFLSIVPVGLIWAQFENVNLRRMTVESERAEENLEPEAAVDADPAS